MVANDINVRLFFKGLKGEREIFRGNLVQSLGTMAKNALSLMRINFKRDEMRKRKVFYWDIIS